MSGDEQKRIFAKNLNFLMELNEKTQNDIIIDLGINKSTISTWCAGTKIPRMGTIQTLADYFKVKKSDLLDDNAGKQERRYYLNDETRKIAQEIYDNKEMKILFDASRKAKANLTNIIQC